MSDYMKTPPRRPPPRAGFSSPAPPSLRSCLAAARAQASREVRIGYQKYGTLTLLKGRGTLEKRLAAQGHHASSGPSSLPARCCSKA